MNLEYFPHGTRELVTEIGTSSIVYLSLPRYLILAPIDTLGLPMLRCCNQLSDYFLPETGGTLGNILLRLE